MRTLVSHAGALGDFITTLPAIRVWRRLHPGRRVVLLGRPGHAALCPELVDETWDAQSARFASLFGSSPDAGLAPMFSGFDSALLFSPASSPLSRHLAALGVREIVRQDPFPPADGGVTTAAEVHVVDWHLSLFPPAVVTEADRVPLVVALPAGEGEEQPVARTVVIAPGSGSESKNWPRERYEELSRLLSARGMRVAWIMGPAEEAMQVPRGIEAWRNLPLPMLASRLACSALCVGNDSGISHLAAAVGCPLSRAVRSHPAGRVGATGSRGAHRALCDRQARCAGSAGGVRGDRKAAGRDREG